MYKISSSATRSVLATVVSFILPLLLSTFWSKNGINVDPLWIVLLLGLESYFMFCAAAHIWSAQRRFTAHFAEAAVIGIYGIGALLFLIFPALRSIMLYHIGCILAAYMLLFYANYPVLILLTGWCITCLVQIYQGEGTPHASSAMDIGLLAIQYVPCLLLFWSIGLKAAALAKSSFSNLSKAEKTPKQEAIRHLVDQVNEELTASSSTYQAQKHEAKRLQNIAARLKAMHHYLTQLQYQVRDFFSLSIQSCHLDKLLQEGARLFQQFRGVRQGPLLHINNQANGAILHCDPAHIIFLFMELFEQINREKVYLSVGTTLLHYPSTASHSDNTRPALCLYISSEEASLEIAQTYTYEDDILHPSSEGLQQHYIVRAHLGMLTPIPTGYRILFPLRPHLSVQADQNTAEKEPWSMLSQADLSAPEEMTFLVALKQHKELNTQHIKACLKAVKTYYEQTNRKTGERFYLHPIAIAHVVQRFYPMEDMICASLLYNVREKITSLGDATHTFLTEKVSALLGSFSLLEHVMQQDLSWEEKQHKWQQHLDPTLRKAFLIKAASRLHNLATLHVHSIAKQEEILEETTELFLPFMEELGCEPLRQMLQSALEREKEGRLHLISSPVTPVVYEEEPAEV